MLGTLTSPAGSSLRFSPRTFRSDRRISFGTRRAVICAAVAEASPEVESMRYRRPPESLYEVLRVKRDASIREIKAAYRSLAKMYHPDVSSVPAAAAAAMDGKEFMEIHEAYATLSDPDARAEYDMALGMSSRDRRRPIMRYQSSADNVRARAGSHTTRRWETDQCW